MRKVPILLKTIDGEKYELKTKQNYEEVLSEIYSSKKENGFYSFEDHDNSNKRITVNINHIVSIIEEYEKPYIKPFISGGKNKK